MRITLNSRMMFAACAALVGIVPIPARGQDGPPAPPVLIVEPAEAPPVATPEPTLIIVVAATEPAPTEPAPTELAATEPAPTELATTELATTELATTELVAEPEEAPFVPGFVSAGGSILIGTRPTEDGLSPTWFGGFDLSFRIDPMVSLGLRRVHAGTFGDDRYWSVGASPFVELTLRPWERVHFYGQVGAAIDLRIASSNAELDSPSVAPFLGVGARFYLCRHFSVAVEGVAHVPLTGGLAIGESIAPDFAVTLQGGLAIAFHFE